MAGLGFQTFDEQTASSGLSPDARLLPGNLQVHNPAWPTPADQVSDHGAEGAPWQAAPGTINQPSTPPLGPLWMADHDGPTVGAVSPDNQLAAATRPHSGHQKPQAYPTGVVNLGHPFTAKIKRLIRHLATDRWDDTGKRVSPPDARSAEVQIYGSQHFTVPRMIGYEAAPLFSWAWAASDQFSEFPGYLGVHAGVPNLAPRPSGAVAAQSPDDPFVARAEGQAQPAATMIDYDLGYWWARSSFR